MTSQEFMLVRRKRTHSALRAGCARCALAVLVVALGACETAPRLEQPVNHMAPYAQPRVWAVAPFNNESGVSRLDPAHLADQFAQEIEQVNGLRVIPVNRVLSAMQALNIPAITSDTQAIALLEVLGVDGLIVGTITAYDAYTPLTLGLAVQLYSRDMAAGQSAIDARAIMRSGTSAEAAALPQVRATVASGIFDASNHETRSSLREYARGRSAPESAYGERIYLVSMDSYARFVAWRLIGDLLAVEAQRAKPSAPGPENPPV